jgi:hypothetical protein
MVTDIALKNAKPKDRDYTIPVDTRLALLVKVTGNKLWRYRYSYLGKRCMLSVGKYPQTTIKQARAKVLEYQDLLEQGINPSVHR